MPSIYGAKVFIEEPVTCKRLPVLLPHSSWVNIVHKYKIKLHGKMKHKQTTHSTLWKKVHKFLKYRKKDNDYGLWMKHQRELFPVISNLGCMDWHNLTFLGMYPEPTAHLLCKLKR